MAKGECLSTDGFRPIPGYEGTYEINAAGEVWSRDREVRVPSGWKSSKGGAFKFVQGKPIKKRGPGYMLQGSYFNTAELVKRAFGVQ